MKDGICVKCGEHEVYFDASGMYGIHVPLSMLIATHLNLYVCKSCGYLEFYVGDFGDKENIPNKFQKVKVKK